MLHTANLHIGHQLAALQEDTSTGASTGVHEEELAPQAGSEEAARTAPPKTVYQSSGIDVNRKAAHSLTANGRMAGYVTPVTAQGSLGC